MIGGMSDLWGRKPFLVITVLFTCLPIPFISINAYLYFTLVAFSGLFSVTFSVVFAYVSDITDEQNRAWAYGAVSLIIFFACLSLIIVYFFFVGFSNVCLQFSHQSCRRLIFIVVIWRWLGCTVCDICCTSRCCLYCYLYSGIFTGKAQTEDCFYLGDSRSICLIKTSRKWSLDS